MSLYEKYKKENPRRFRVDHHIGRSAIVEDELPYYHPCANCVVRKKRNPTDCDPCKVNPDRERMKRSGLL